ncbi:histidine phosphatase family protein [Bifidobacterium castoris]|nr:histidine phosphatase family protein [Bifidobacterium castoris]MDE5640865.1 histidine phosphatase family protein [Bifidobacterium castoris]
MQNSTMNDHAKRYGTLVLLRHGQTRWSESGQYTGRTNIPLTDIGMQQARDAGARLRTLFPDGFADGDVYCSDLQRAMTTAREAGFASPTLTADLEEWDYGRAEGRTRAELFAALGEEWDIWSQGPTALAEHLAGERVEVFPDGQQITIVNGPGERIEEAAQRARRVIDQATPALEAGRDVLCVAHAHILRILTTQWLGMEPRFGRHLKLDTAHICALSVYKGDHVIWMWNV